MRQQIGDERIAPLSIPWTGGAGEYGLREVVPRRRDWLAGLPMDAEEILCMTGITPLQKNRDRELLTIPPSPSRPTLMVKIHRESDRFARMRRALGWGRARLEWYFLRQAEQLEVPVPRPVAWFSSPSGDGVVTEYLLDTEPFPAYLERYTAGARAQILRRLGALVAQMARAGIEARDFHTGNVLARGHDAPSTQLWIVDLHDARRRESILESAQDRMLVQVAQALGGTRAGSDVEEMLSGWAAAARNLGINSGWGRGPVHIEDGIAFQSVCPRRRERLEVRVESRERHRRRRRLRRGVRRHGLRKNGNGWTYWRSRGFLDHEFPARIRSRSQRLDKGVAAEEGLQRAWQGNLIEQVLLHRSPPVLLYRQSLEKGRWNQHLIERVPQGNTLRHWLQNEETNDEGMNCVSLRPLYAVLDEVVYRHREGIRLKDAGPERWHLIEKSGGYQANVDPWCLEYQGKISIEERLEDLLGVITHYSGSFSRSDRLRCVLHCFPNQEDRRRLRRNWRNGVEMLARQLRDPSLCKWSDRIIESIRDGDRRRRETVTAERLQSLHHLNQSNAPEVGSLDPEEFSRLVDRAHRVWTVDDPDTCAADPAALLVVMKRDSEYDSPNFLWFQKGFERFAYIDRIAVDERARRRGIGESLYLTLEAWARSRGLERLVCEVNLQPRNENSIAFHTSLGFREVGQYIGRGKGVLMLEKPLGQEKHSAGY